MHTQKISRRNWSGLRTRVLSSCGRWEKTCRRKQTTRLVSLPRGSARTAYAAGGRRVPNEACEVGEPGHEVEEPDEVGETSATDGPG